MIASLRVLVEMQFPSKTVRLWDGAGPFVCRDGYLWAGLAITEGLDVVESAINGEAASLDLGVSGVATDIANIAFRETDAGDVIGSTIRLLIQECDAADQPTGDKIVRFTGLVDNIAFEDSASGDNALSAVTITCRNRFTLRNLISGSVLSDTDQRARSAKVNPAAAADRFCERVPMLIDKTLKWPRFT